MNYTPSQLGPHLSNHIQEAIKKALVENEARYNLLYDSVIQRMDSLSERINNLASALIGPDRRSRTTPTITELDQLSNRIDRGMENLSRRISDLEDLEVSEQTREWNRTDELSYDWSDWQENEATADAREAEGDKSIPTHSRPDPYPSHPPLPLNEDSDGAGDGLPDHLTNRVHKPEVSPTYTIPTHGYQYSHESPSMHDKNIRIAELERDLQAEEKGQDNLRRYIADLSQRVEVLDDECEQWESSMEKVVADRDRKNLVIDDLLSHLRAVLVFDDTPSRMDARRYYNRMSKDQI
jgi:hypothetical protein